MGTLKAGIGRQNKMQATVMDGKTTPTFHQHPNLRPLEQVVFPDVLPVSYKGDLNQHAVVQKPAQKNSHIPPKTGSRIERIVFQLIFDKNRNR